MSEKTCGNCYHCVPRHGTRFRKLDGVCLYTGYAVDTQSTSPITPCGNHRMWRERKNTLEQRYERLSNVAREMLVYLACIKADVTMIKLTHDTQMFREKLRECGVSIDD